MGECGCTELRQCSSDWQMAVLCPVVLPQATRPVDMSEPEDGERCRVGLEAVGRDRFRRDGLIAKETPQQFQRCARVPIQLHYKAQDLAHVIDRSPQIHAPASDFANHLIEVPSG